MLGTNAEDAKEQELAKTSPDVQVDGDFSKDDQKDVEIKEESSMPSAAQEKEAILKKKYGGTLPKKPPLISKDHERAFFDSADWALGKQGAGAPIEKPKGPLEALQPKLQPTRNNQSQSRRSAYAPADNENDVGNNNNGDSED
ncbi:hypothetical protein IFM89_006470 [Coptis chinensis]|uniref:cAMP-regulated phosphoprotein 19-related protein n=1 Tax=Coptis chinensis TaxID=261450 RepID=A0A835M4G3_9MAGN|nr:hypothetical protein IFM89_006470 [Coptis chinensis]